MSYVMVVPETKEFQLHVSHSNLVWITKHIGIPLITCVRFPHDVKTELFPPEVHDPSG